MSISSFFFERLLENLFILPLFYPLSFKRAHISRRRYLSLSIVLPCFFGIGSTGEHPRSLALASDHRLLRIGLLEVVPTATTRSFTHFVEAGLIGSTPYAAVASPLRGHARGCCCMHLGKRKD